tara:strand:+ start:1296 stop:3191 length:1896 start_codon:yes stop_codon:yes gene_type:complete
MPHLYKNKIVQAFRDNAIKSVLLIDDEYLPYEGLVNRYVQLNDELKEVFADVVPTDPDAVDKLRDKLKLVRESVSSANTDLMNSETAEKFVNFFHGMQLNCDVENQTDNLDTDKIRKSDLIILDYHLRKNGDNRAEKSLNLISTLSTSKHMNMIVVYTAEPLVNVWFEIASSLRGTFLGVESDFFDTQELTDWQENATDWLEVWGNVVDRDIDAAYLCNDHDIEDLYSKVTQECEDLEYEIPSEVHVNWMLERSVNKYNLNQKEQSELEVHGSRSLWIQAGDAFVVLCSKSQDDGNNGFRVTTPDEVWELIKTALVDWYPSFYRVVTSELQNQIEDANLSMEKVIAKGHIEQIAYLWGVLRVGEEERSEAVKELLKNLMEDVVEKVHTSQELLTFVQNTAETVDDPMPAPITDTPEREKAYIQSVLSSAHKNQKGLSIIVDKDFRCAVGHARNVQLSVDKVFPSYISTGVVVKNLDCEGEYYVCIAPSCNTIPNQHTGLVIQRMKPHRPMRFIKLNKSKLVDALGNAHKSQYIFVSDGEERIALDVIEKGEAPTIVEGVIINHDGELITRGGFKDVQFIETNSGTQALEVITKRLQPLAKLKPGFASRYQNTQLLYEWRIGVDLVTANMKD